ncbi:unnamed protein product, partial [Scytosiphon promiscuus]
KAPAEKELLCRKVECTAVVCETPQRGEDFGRTLLGGLRKAGQTRVRRRLFFVLPTPCRVLASFFREMIDRLVVGFTSASACVPACNCSRCEGYSEQPLVLLLYGTVQILQEKIDFHVQSMVVNSIIYAGQSVPRQQQTFFT